MGIPQNTSLVLGHKTSSQITSLLNQTCTDHNMCIFTMAEHIWCPKRSYYSCHKAKSGGWPPGKMASSHYGLQQIGLSNTFSPSVCQLVRRPTRSDQTLVMQLVTSYWWLIWPPNMFLPLSQLGRHLQFCGPHLAKQQLMKIGEIGETGEISQIWWN